MSVSPGGALVWSAALHALGVGLAGWTTHGLYRESPPAVAPLTTRVHALQYLTLIPPRPQPRPTPPPARARVGPRRPALPPPAPPPAPASTPVSSEAVHPAVGPLDGGEQRVQELEPGPSSTAAPSIASPAPETPPVRRDVDRGAALVAAAGAACPELPLPEAWAHRYLAVAVAVVVDTNGVVDRSRVRVVESPGRPPADRSFYPRIYVVGARARVAGRGDAADYESAVTDAVARHVAALEFHPALKDGRAVPSTVLIACQRSPAD